MAKSFATCLYKNGVSHHFYQTALLLNRWLCNESQENNSWKKKYRNGECLCWLYISRAIFHPLKPYFDIISFQIFHQLTEHFQQYISEFHSSLLTCTLESVYSTVSKLSNCYGNYHDAIDYDGNEFFCSMLDQKKHHSLASNDTIVKNSHHLKSRYPSTVC